MPIQPTPGDVHVNQVLTNVSIAYTQAAENFVAGRFAPVVPVDHQSDKYAQFPRGMFYRSQMKKRAAGARAERIGYTVDTSASYFADVYAVAHPIPDMVRKNADQWANQDRAATKLVTQQDLIKREKTFVSNMLTTGKWTTDITGVSAGPTGNQVLQWNNANSTPLEDIAAGKQTILQSTGFEPMDLVIGYPVWKVLKNHPEIVGRINGGATTALPAKVMLQLVAELMELDNIYVMKGIENTADEGQNDSFSFIGGKVALLAYNTRAPGMEEPSASYTFAWKGYTGMNDNATRIKMYRNEDEASDIVEAESAWDMKLVAADLGYFFTSLVA